jgi:N-acetyl-gamma-glutamyl-phosphate reductase
LTAERFVLNVNAMNVNKSPRKLVGVVGATGYTGLEVLRILRDHRGVEVRFATSEGNAGQPSALPGLTLVEGARAPLDQVDVVFLCLPHGKAVEWASRARQAGARVVDLTADHRPGSGREDGWVYGMADLVGDCVAESRLIANPGCYPTGVQLALHPLLHSGLIDTTRVVVVNAASGVTGAGRSPKRELMFAEVASDYRAYSLGNEHRHIPEMRAGLPGLQLLFQPHLLPVARGILETIYVPVNEGVDARAVRAAWSTAFGGSATIRISEGAPTLTEVVGTDLLVLGASDNDRIDPPIVTVMATLDNLGKGAAGQAVHNMNLMLGLDPAQGLRC